MSMLIDDHTVACGACRDATPPPAVTMAFQPIVDVRTGSVWGHEALARGADGQSAEWVFGRVDDTNRLCFDQLCRVRAVEQARRLELPPSQVLSINFLPTALDTTETCICTTAAAADAVSIPTGSLLFEMAEVEKVEDPDVLRGIVTHCRSMGLRTAIDDFGAGHSGLKLLADFVPDVVKLDMGLVRAVDADVTRHVIVRAVGEMARDLGIAVIAEGVETLDEARALHDLGVRLHQGFLYGRPAFDALAPVDEEVVREVAGARVLAADRQDAPDAPPVRSPSRSMRRSRSAGRTRAASWPGTAR